MASGFRNRYFDENYSYLQRCIYLKQNYNQIQDNSYLINMERKKQKRRVILQEENLPIQISVPTTFISKWAPDIDKLWNRDVKLHLICMADNLYDDNMLFYQEKWTNYKIHSICVRVDSRGFVDYLKFTYINLANGKTKAGYSMGSHSDYHEKMKPVQLQKDEFVIGVEMRKGMIIDSLKFVTSKGNIIGQGGKGGEHLSYKAPQGYHIGAIACSAKHLIHGIQFDLKKIPQMKIHGKTQQKVKKSFLFFENQQLFGYAIKFLSCRDVMKLFRVNKKVAEYRKTSVQFWLKCINFCDQILLGYLYGLMQQYKILELGQYLKIYKWTIMNLVGDKQNNNSRMLQLNPQQIQNNFKNGESYLIIIAAQFKNSVLAFKDCIFLLQDSSETIRPSVIQGQQTSKECAAFLVRKFAILVRYNKDTHKDLTNMKFIVKARTTWYEAYECEIVKCYAMSTVCYAPDIVSHHFERYNQDILINSTNRSILKSEK